jgi:hypothetical protein
MRPCPHCSREIFDAAFECIYCGKDVRQDAPAFPSVPPPRAWPEPPAPLDVSAATPTPFAWPQTPPVTETPPPAPLAETPPPAPPREPAPRAKEQPRPAPPPPPPPVIPQPAVMETRRTAAGRLPIPRSLATRTFYAKEGVTVTGAAITFGSSAMPLHEIREAKIDVPGITGCGCLGSIAAVPAAFIAFGNGAAGAGLLLLVAGVAVGWITLRAKFILQLIPHAGAPRPILRDPVKAKLTPIADAVNAAIAARSDASIAAMRGGDADAPAELPWERPGG